MKNVKIRKRLNNKGFTLIELLAVVVILAVLMGIAVTSVLSSMNKSRGGSLADTTSVIVHAFNQKYTESLVDGVPNSVYGEYDFTTDSQYYLVDTLANEFSISPGSYSLFSSKDITVTSNAATVTSSFVAFDADNGKFLVCMKANNDGNVYVAGYAVGGANASGNTSVTFDGVTYTFGTGSMFACSDGTTSW